MSYSIVVFGGGAMLLIIPGYPTEAQLEVIREFRFIWSRPLSGWFAFADPVKVIINLEKVRPP